MEMFQVEERGYYAKIMCNKVQGLAASLYRALESLAGFNVQNSNLATVDDSFLLTFTLNVGCPLSFPIQSFYIVEMSYYDFCLWI